MGDFWGCLCDLHVVDALQLWLGWCGLVGVCCCGVTPVSPWSVVGFRSVWCVRPLRTLTFLRGYSSVYGGGPLVLSLFWLGAVVFRRFSVGSSSAGASIRSALLSFFFASLSRFAFRRVASLRVCCCVFFISVASPRPLRSFCRAVAWVVRGPLGCGGRSVPLVLLLFLLPVLIRDCGRCRVIGGLLPRFGFFPVAGVSPAGCCRGLLARGVFKPLTGLFGGGIVYCFSCFWLLFLPRAHVLARSVPVLVLVRPPPCVGPSFLACFSRVFFLVSLVVALQVVQCPFWIIFFASSPVSIPFCALCDSFPLAHTHFIGPRVSAPARGRSAPAFSSLSAVRHWVLRFFFLQTRFLFGALMHWRL